MKTVLLWPNAVDPAYETHEVPDVRDFLMARFASWPKTARIYQGQPAEANDVTPNDVAGIARLATLPGPFAVVVYPEVAAMIPYVIVAIAAAAMAFLFRPKVPNLGKTTPGSSNNDLSDRQNTARVHGRVPDIFGTVRSTPDLLAQPYKVFENNREIEYAYMCIGRGSYDIATRADGRHDVCDDTTPVENIAAAVVKVFGPSTSPNSGTAQLTLPSGGIITEPVRNVKRFTSVNGQELLAPNEGIKVAMRCEPTAQIVLWRDEQTDFTEHFNVGDSIVLTWRGYVRTTTSTPGYELKTFDGTYTIASLTETTITLTSPAAVNASWTGLLALIDTGDITASAYPTGTIYKSGDKWEGPYVLDVDTQTEVWANVVAPSGLYRINGSNVQSAIDVTFEIEATPINASGTATGSAATQQAILQGSSIDRKQRAMTLRYALGYTGRASIRMRRVTNKDYSGTYPQQQDEIQWRDVYSVSPVSLTDFGDVTTVQSRMEGNKNALAVKNRKLNLLVTRKVKRYGVAPLDADGFSTSLLATNSAADILVHVCRDPRIGNRALDEIDVAGIYSTIADVVDYFGTAAAAEFCATLDKDNLSFEETAAMIAGAVFCTAYRRGSEIKLSFEKETSDSTLLFNHRNKIPGSETRTFAFTNPDGNDGVELEYVDPSDDSVQTFYLPEDRSAVNPKKIETAGIRGRLHAFFHANRAMNRLLHQRVATEFEACQEADLLVLNDRILVADNTRPETQDGQVMAQSGLTLEVSQPVTLEAGKTYTIFLQIPDGTVDSMPVAAGSDDQHVLLSRAPSSDLTIDPNTTAQGALFQIVPDYDPRERAFLVTEKEPQEHMTSIVRAVNYDARYYQSDRLYALGYVDDQGNSTGSTPLVGPDGYDSEGTLADVLAALSALVNTNDFP